MEKKITLRCKFIGEGLLSCKIKKEEKECENIKEEGIGISGPIFNLKRVCPIKKPREILTKW